MRNSLSVGAIVAALAFTASAAKAEVFTWSVDSSQSYARLTFNDQVITYSGVTATVRPRATNATAATVPANAWTDTTGRKASLGGSFQADYVTDGFGQTFLDFGASNVTGLNTAGLLAQPDPASWDPNTSTYTNTNAVEANFSTRVYLVALGGLVNANIRLAIRDSLIALDSSQILLGGGTTIGANETSVGLTSGQIGVKGGSIGGLATIPDILDTVSSSPTVNTSAGSVTGATLLKTIDLPIFIPITIEVAAGVSITASISGRIVATATVPEVGSTMLVALGLVGVGVPVAIRRRRAC